jgi:hypothetical protein
VTGLEYDPTVALGYSIEHGLRGCLALNAKAFEKAAPALGLEFVTEVTTPKAYIDKEL